MYQRTFPRVVVTAFVLLAASSMSAEFLLVANKSDNTVDILDLGNGLSLATLPTGHAPHEIAVSPDGSRAVITNYGDRDHPGSSLTVVDVAGLRVVSTLDLRSHSRPHGATFIDADRVVVTAEGSAQLLLVNISSGEIEHAIGTDQDISHMVVAVPDRQRAFVANIGSHSVTVIDLARGEKIRDIATGQGAEGLAVSPDGQEVWVSNREADTLSVIDAASLEIVATIPCPGFPIRLAFTPEGERVLVSAARSGEIVVIDARRRAEMLRTKLDLSNAADASGRLFGDRFGESPVPVGLEISPTGSTAWIAATQADVIVVVDTGSLEVLGLLRAGREPDGMALSSVDRPARSQPSDS